MNDQAAWVKMNDQHLSETVAWIRLLLQRNIVEPSQEEKEQEAEQESSWFWNTKPAEPKMLPSPLQGPTEEEVKDAAQEIGELEGNDPPPALKILASRLGLSKFDVHVLSLCVAMELDTRIAGLCAKAQDDLNKPFPTFALVFAVFDNPDWNSLSPHAPLRYWRLLEINQPGAQPLTGAALHADERIVNYLKGLNYLDDRLVPLLDPVGVQPDEAELPPSQQQVVNTIMRHVKGSYGKGRAPIVELLGHDSTSKRLIAGHTALALGVNLHVLDLKTLPTQTGDFETFTRLWQRESLLMPLALYIDSDGASDAERAQLKRFVQRTNGLIFLDEQHADTDVAQNRVVVEVMKPTTTEQQQLWIEALQDDPGKESPCLAEQFSFNQGEISRIAKTVLDGKLKKETRPGVDLWQSCRAAARVGMEQLAQRIDAKATWDQLVLPSEQQATLRHITQQVNQRNRVYDDWGFRNVMNRGLGISALFAGESGTGKTMAAEVIANELQLDLYRIDLSSVVNKYIGETEKNLRKLFDAAEDSGAIVFFDEADALFGKRSEVKDSHDRYANIEVNYLLQRMESYKGLAILATNLKNALDKAFVRRLRFIVDFSFPGIEERKEMWRKVFPPETPVHEDLDYQRLAKLSLTGGNIHNVALNAAFLAAQEDSPVTMALILSAARIEFKKLERPAKESDFIWQENLKVVP